MKNLFGIFRKTNDSNFKKFVIKELSKETTEKIDNLSNEKQKLKKKKTPPNWLAYIYFPAGAFGLILVSAMLVAKDGFLAALENRGFIFYIGIALIVFAIATFIYCHITSKKLAKDPEVEAYNESVIKITKECDTELEIPDTAVSFDVLMTLLKINKKGKEVLDQMSLLQYINQNVYIFVQDEMLCFADNIMVIGIPVNGIKAIKKIKKRMVLPQWNKEETIKSPTYKEYKMTMNDAGLVWMKHYYEISCDINGEEYYFLIPCYEKDAFLKTIGIEIPEIE